MSTARSFILLVIVLSMIGSLAIMPLPVQGRAASPTIQQIQNNPSTYIDQTVTIRGTVGQYIDRDAFLLDDGTGQIVVDLDLLRNRRITIPTGTTATVTGEIDRMRDGGVDLDACLIETPTEVIQIEECDYNPSMSALSSTQTSSPPSSNSPTIGQIQSNPNAYIDQIVTMSGTVGRYVNRNELLLDDGTGQIVVDPGPPWYRQIAIPTGTRVTVTGQIDRMRGGGVDLDACRIETPTETIQIRDCSFNGPPPWAGGPRGRGRP